MWRLVILILCALYSESQSAIFDESGKHVSLDGDPLELRTGISDQTVVPPSFTPGNITDEQTSEGPTETSSVQSNSTNVRSNEETNPPVVDINDVSEEHDLTNEFKEAKTVPRQLFPHELSQVSLDKPVVYHPQPFSYPGYPVVLYL